MNLNQIITENFKDISRDTNRLITRGDIQKFLSKRCESEFDREVFQQIIDKCEEDGSRLTVSNLSAIWSLGINTIEGKLKALTEKKSNLNEEYSNLINKSLLIYCFV